MSWITTRKTLLGFIVLLTFVISANALLFGSHAVEESQGAFTASAATGHDHQHDGDHGDSSDDTHCCDTHHSHDVTGNDPFVLESWIPYSELCGINPPHHLLEVVQERFIPPQHHA